MWIISGGGALAGGAIISIVIYHCSRKTPLPQLEVQPPEEEEQYFDAVAVSETEV